MIDKEKSKDPETGKYDSVECPIHQEKAIRKDSCTVICALCTWGVYWNTDLLEWEQI